MSVASLECIRTEHCFDVFRGFLIFPTISRCTNILIVPILESFSLSFQYFKSGLWMCEAVVVIPALEPWRSWFLTVFHAPEKVLKRLIQSANHVLRNLRAQVEIQVF